MKLAFFAIRYPVPSQTFITDQIAAMVLRGHDVTIIAVDRGDGKIDPRIEGARLVVLRQAGARRSRAIPRLLATALRSAFGLRRAGAALRAIARKLPESALDIAAYRGEPLKSFDAVVCHFGPAGVRAAALRSAGILDGPICTIFHGYDVSKTGTLKRYLPHYRRLFRETELLLPISDLWARRLVSWGAPPEKVVVQRMGVDLGRLTAEPLDRSISRPLRVLSVARLVEKKGIRFAIEGVRRAAVPIEYTIIGSGPDEEILRDQAAGSSNLIRFLGRQPHSAVFAELARSDVFLLPSITASDGDMEGIPVALMEAMATGVITVATRHSANDELITDGHEGLLVTEGDESEIATALERISSGCLDDYAIRHSARAKVHREFNNAKLNADLERLLVNIRGGSV